MDKGVEYLYVCLLKFGGRVISFEDEKDNTYWVQVKVPMSEEESSTFFIRLGDEEYYIVSILDNPIDLL